MSSKTRYVFISPEEFATWLAAMADDLPVAIALATPSAELAMWAPTDAAPLRGAVRAYLFDEPPDLAGLRADTLQPAALGAVVLEVPRVVGDRLVGIHLHATTEWIDEASGEARERATAVKLFNRLWGSSKRRFSRPVLACPPGGEELADRSLSYTAGAAAWYRAGKRLARVEEPETSYRIPATADAAD
jgi:hypothetical protein